jgi:hypothetical protein
VDDVSYMDANWPLSVRRQQNCELIVDTESDIQNEFDGNKCHYIWILKVYTVSITFKQ